MWDLAIIGAGTAGLPAAIRAASGGARVLLIEAADRIGGTLHLSSGSLSAGGVRDWNDRARDDSAQDHYADCVRLSGGSAHTEILKLWTDHAGATVDWLLANGLKLNADQPVFGGAHEAYKVARTYNPVGGACAYLQVLEPLLQELIAAGKIELHLSTRMRELTRDADGAVNGVVAERSDGATVVFPARQVLLTTGGYLSDDATWAQMHDAPRRVYGYPTARGDGLRAGLAVGGKAAFAEHFLPTYGASQDLDRPDIYWIHTRLSPGLRPPWEIVVNQRGERFFAEDNPSPDARERALKAQPDHSYWVIYDERIRREAPALFLWDEEKVARGFVKGENLCTADSLNALAEACGIDAVSLTKTVELYNVGQTAGDDSLGRKHLPAPIAEAPFYGIRHNATSVVTWGGLAADGELRVLGADGAPIPNLYAAGEVLGMGVFGHTFLGGSTVSSSLTFGRLLGERLAKTALPA